MIKNILLLCLSIALGILFFEAGLRLARISYPYYDRADEWTGFSLRPSAKGWYTQEGKAYFAVNRQGFRGPERTLSPQKDVLRIAILGDSFTEARQVEEEETFSAILENHLQKYCDTLRNQKVEVLNFGVSAYGTAQQFLQLQHRIWQFEPDIILLAFFGNDISDNSKDFQFSNQRPYFDIVDGRLVPDMSFRDNTWYRTQQSWYGKVFHALVHRSRTLQLLNHARRRIGAVRRDISPAPGEQEDIAPERSTDSVTIYRPPENPQWQNAWHITEMLLREMMRETKEHDALFVLTNVSSAGQVDPDLSVQKNLMDHWGVPDLLYLQRWLQSIAKEENAIFIPIIESLRTYAETHAVCVHGFTNNSSCRGHWNEQGHRIVGTQLAKNLCASL